MRNAEILANLADPTFQTELGQFNLELNARPRLIDGDGFADYEHDIQASLGRAEDRADKADATIVLIGILPTLTPRPPGARQPLQQRAVPGPQRADRRGPRRGHRARHPWRGTAADLHRLDRAGGGVHQRAVPPAGLAGHVRRLLERLAVDRRHPGRRSARTRLTCTGNSSGRRPGSPCSSRPPTPVRTSSRRRGYAPGSGSASGGSPRSSTCSRRTCATSRRCCRSPTTRTRSRCCTAAACRDSVSCGCTTAPSTAGTGPVYDIMNGRPHLRVENRVLPAGPTVIDMLANAAFYFGLVRDAGRGTTVRSGRSCRSPWPRRTSTPPPGAASTRRSTGRGSARSGSPTWCWTCCCRGRPRGWTASASHRASATSCSASSRNAAAPGATARPGRRRRSAPPNASAAWTARPRCTTCSAATAS